MNPATNPFSFLGQSLESALNAYLLDTTTRLVHAILPLAGLSLYLIIVVYGFMITTGRITVDPRQMLLKGMSIVIITTLALSAHTYLTWVVDTLRGLEAGITAVVGGSDGQTVYAVLDDAMASGLALVGKCTENAARAGWMEMGTMINWYITAGALTIAFGMVFVTGGIAILLAKLLLAVLLAIGPLCILCLLHPLTANFFKDWFGQAVTFILQIALAVAVISIAVKLFGRAIEYIDLSPTSRQNPVLSSLIVMVIGLTLQAVVGGTALVAGRVGGGAMMHIMRATDAARAALAPMRAAYNLANPTSTRLDPRTGYPMTARRLEHIAMGRTVAAPAYRQVLLEHMRNGWKKPPGGTIKGP